MKKIFLSMPMHGRSEEEIKKAREEYTEQAKAIFTPENVEIIDNYHHVINDVVAPQRRHYLAESIRQMVRADFVIFCPGWELGAGCRVEHQICEVYGIDYLDIVEEPELDELKSISNKAVRDKLLEEYYKKN